MSELPELEYVNSHTFPCGCRFLVAWQETRVREDGLYDLLEIHRYLHAIGKAKPAPEPRMRIVTQAEAEAIVRDKRGHEWWTEHVVGAERQPTERLCARHATLPYTLETFRAINDAG